MGVHRQRRRFGAFATPFRLLALLLLPLALAAADEAAAPLAKKNPSGDPDVLVTEGLWKNPGGGVNKKFETPCGAVYRFTESAPYAVLYGARDDVRAGVAAFHTKRSCQCGTCQVRYRLFALESAIPPAKKEKKRFVAVDFFIRKFPALSRDDRSDFSFVVAFSNYAEINADWVRVTKVLQRNQLGLFSYLDEACRDPGAATCLGAPVFNPQFGWNHCRIVIDNEPKSKTVITVFSNGNVLFIRPKMEIRGLPTDINAVAILLDNYYSLRPIPLIEISEPTFYRFDRIEDLVSLPPPGYRFYPYDLYAGDARLKANRRDQSRKNPDAQYAEALRMLRRPGEAPLPKATELLEKAADDDHVFANYELGVCYQYGVGVRRDPDKAAKYFHRAAKRGYHDDVAVTRFLLLWAQAPHEIFVGEELNEANAACRDLNQTCSSGAAHLDLSFSGISRTSGPAAGNWRTVKFSDLSDPLPFPAPWESIFRGKKILCGHPVSINHIPVSAMYGGAEASTEDDPAAWYIGKLKRYMDENYGGAFVRYGELWRQQARLHPEKTNDYLRHARSAFQRGAQQNDDESQLEAWRTESEFGILKPEAFSLETDIRFHRNPQYYLLKYLAAHPGQEWEAAFQRKNYPWALRKMPAADTPERKYLRGLMLVAPYFDGGEGFRKVRYRLMDGFSGVNGTTATAISAAWDQAIEGYQLIEEAADAGLPETKFLIGMLYLVTPDRTVTAVRWSANREKGIKLLSSLDPVKWPLASYYIVQYTSQQTNLNIKIAEWEKRLKPACDANFGPAWYLLGQLYERYHYPPKAEAAYTKAGDAGMNLGYSTAACMMDESRRDSRAMWQRFLKLHLEERRRSRFDPFDENISVHCPEWRMPPNLDYPTFDFRQLLP